MEEGTLQLAQTLAKQTLEDRQPGGVASEYSEAVGPLKKNPNIAKMQGFR
jgi:hypothetical protein